MFYLTPFFFFLTNDSSLNKPRYPYTCSQLSMQLFLCDYPSIYHYGGFVLCWPCSKQAYGNEMCLFSIKRSGLMTSVQIIDKRITQWRMRVWQIPFIGYISQKLTVTLSFFQQKTQSFNGVNNGACLLLGYLLSNTSNAWIF